MQVKLKLLQVIQDGQVVRVGTTNQRPVDVRILAATNRTLAAEVAAGRFRSDLLLRLAVALIRLPPTRERTGDFTLLVERLLARFNEDSASDPTWQPQTLAPSALNRLARHTWRGNVRELANTLAGAALWSQGRVVTEQDVADALLDLPTLSASQGDGLFANMDLRANSCLPFHSGFFDIFSESSASNYGECGIRD